MLLVPNSNERLCGHAGSAPNGGTLPLRLVTLHVLLDPPFVMLLASFTSSSLARFANANGDK